MNLYMRCPHNGCRFAGIYLKREPKSAYFSHPEGEAVIEKAFKDMNYLQRPMPHCTRRRRKREFLSIIMSNSGNSKEGCSAKK